MGCGDPDPYTLGLKFTLKTDVERKLILSLVDGVEEPEESIGLIGFGTLSSHFWRMVVNVAKADQQVLLIPTSLSHSDEFSNLSLHCSERKSRNFMWLPMKPSTATQVELLSTLHIECCLIKMMLLFSSGYYGVAADEYSVRSDVGSFGVILKS